MTQGSSETRRRHAARVSGLRRRAHEPPAVGLLSFAAAATTLCCLLSLVLLPLSHGGNNVSAAPAPADAPPPPPACLALPNIPPTKPLVPFTTLVSLGASYSSNNLGDVPPPASAAPALDLDGAVRFQGRYSNGPTYVEFLTGPTGLFQDVDQPAKDGRCTTGLLNAKLVDLAFGGAVCDTKIFGKPDPTAVPFSVVQQVATALSTVLPTIDLATALFVFLPTTNDITNVAANASTLPALAACYQNAITSLAAAGAKHFVLGNMYPFDLAPEVANQTAANLTLLHNLIDTLNAELARTVPAAAAAAGANLWLFDINCAMTSYLIPNAPALYGDGANVKDACSPDGVTASDACKGVGVDRFLW